MQGHDLTLAHGWPLPLVCSKSTVVFDADLLVAIVPVRVRYPNAPLPTHHSQAKRDAPDQVSELRWTGSKYSATVGLRSRFKASRVQIDAKLPQRGKLRQQTFTATC